ncbi:dipeptidyl aminopeptidase [Cognaticolwellia beringensis]|uniref:Dipeptidyl aminopeptidase n=2 Tax=Cognaticolwellia beringensis TaxID=1967665 RepID=A0A222GB83_9GAMM|nr:dipeptidyl aminopeptidase [Cognaticolwellia beringensis]
MLDSMYFPKEFLLLTLIVNLMSCVNTTDDNIEYSAGGMSGYDESIKAIEPSSEGGSISLAGEQPVDISRFYTVLNQAPSAASLSYDGKTIAFFWSITGKRQLWTMPIDGGQPKQLTFGNGVTFYRWAKNTNNIIYGADNNGDEQEAYYLISSSGNQESLILPSVSGGFRMFGGFMGENTIVYASSERNKLDFDLYQADLTDGKSKLLLQGKMGLFARSVSPDGKHILVSELVGEDSDNLYLLTTGTNQLKPLSVPTRRAAHSSGGISWTNDSKGFYLSSNLDANYSSLRYYRLGEGFNTLIKAKGDIEYVKLCGKNNRFLLWSVNQGGYSKLFIKDNETQVTKALAENSKGVIYVSCNANVNKAVVSINEWKNPGEIIVVDLEKRIEQTVFETNMAGVDSENLVEPKSITMNARDGVQLQGLLYLPKLETVKGEGLPPVVFSVHGGPAGQSRPVFSPHAQYLLGRGIAVFYPNVRGSTGFGHNYVTLDDQQNRLHSIRDLVDMLDFLKKEGSVDTERAVIRGGSYGGYAVNAALANYPGNFIAGISLFGVSDWVTALQVASPSLKASDRIEYGDITDAKWLEYYSKNSPIRQANKIDVPVLYSHGVRDPRVDVSETEVMVKTLRKNGVRADYIRFLDEGHGWRKFENRLFYAREEAKFLNDIFAR